MKHIGTKLLLFITVTFILFSSFFLYRTYQAARSYVYKIVQQQTDLALQFDLSIRQYVKEKIRPVMHDLLGKDKFIPETMSTSFVARSIFADVHRKFPDIILKFASDNPLNPINKAGPEEMRIIRYLNRHPDQKTWQGNIEINGRLYFAKFNASRIQKECLQCHGKPGDAPAALLKRYGTKSGFFKSVGKVAGLDTIAVPISRIQAQLLNTAKYNLIIMGIALLLFMASIFIIVQKLVSNRLKDIQAHFAAAAAAGDYSHLNILNVHGEDEISMLAKSYNVLAEKLRQYHDSLYAEKERLNVTLRSIGDGVITTDLDGKIILINRIAEKLTGWNMREAVGRPLAAIFNIINEKTGKQCDCPVSRVLRSGGIVDLANHTALIAKDGVQYSIEDSAAPIFDKESRIIGTVLVFRDMTEKKKTRRELLKIKKLESVGILAGGIAHDFNNILTSILGNIELAGIAVEPTAKAYPLLQAAKKASLRAKDLTQQLLTFSKGGAPVKKTTAIDNVIIESANFVLHGSSVSCRFRIPDDLWLADIDAGQISQMIQNLVINAMHAMPGGGNITISCLNIADIKAEIYIGLPETNYIKIMVQDNGCGISKKYIEKIFDPYFTTKQEGSGLGLSITHSIIAKHGGHIDVQSVMENGTIFSIYLPAAKNKIGLNISEKKEEREITKARIIVMDDDKLVQKVAAGMLASIGHEVLLANNGEEAVAILTERGRNGQHVDAIIMDLTIPGAMGGKEAIKEVLKIAPDIKVVVASGYSNDPVMADYRQYGFKAALAKPFTLVELREVLADILEDRTH
ncbi:MAG: DUF3365 domain-containing protein [Deltaproteobacteria bacterium]|nr:DUF3365 domain-containing protein [Deltaproteobacteria bacterium]